MWTKEWEREILQEIERGAMGETTEWPMNNSENPFQKVRRPKRRNTERK